MSPRVAVLIVNWNGGALLERALDCLHRQTRAPERILVVDNASEDRSVDRVNRSHPGVEVMRLAANVGFARANNIGAQEVSDCDWLALLNPDAFPEPGWLEALVQATTDHPDCVSFGSHIRMADNPGRIDGLGDVYHVSGVAWRDAHGLAETDTPPEAREIFSACAAAALYRRDAFLEVGGFDESYFCYFEDVDLGFRLRLRGHNCRYVPGAVVYHQGSASFGYASDFAIYHGNRNLVWTFFKDMPAALLALYLPQHVLWNLASLCYMPLNGRAGVIWRSKWDALRGLAPAIRQRRRTQGNRRISVRKLRRAMARGVLTPYVRYITTRRALARLAVVAPVGSESGLP